MTSSRPHFFSIACLIVHGCVSCLFLSTLDVSILQYRALELDAAVIGVGRPIGLARTEAYNDFELPFMVDVTSAN
ncbi:hypothetical protein B0O99DRAFT_622980 [Bisporella sp. PMI_857]|nr:hypothetical protein B0O99DRAFT_622980 [Bisporella sp. PMI_857]